MWARAGASGTEEEEEEVEEAEEVGEEVGEEMEEEEEFDERTCITDSFNGVFSMGAISDFSLRCPHF